MQIKQNIQIKNSKNDPILVDVFYKANRQAKAVVIFSHGFKGFKDWGHFNEMANYFAEKNFVFVKFNFSHNGITAADPSNFTDLEAFGNNNYLIELDDLKCTIDWVLQADFLSEEINSQLLYLIGHSRGGGISILKAAEDSRVKKLVTWASVSSFTGRHKQRTIETWQKDGVVYATNSRTMQSMPMYYQFYQTIIDHKERLNINHAVKKLEIPFLIIHGTNDEAVPLHDAAEIMKSAKQGELFIIDKANHTFGIKHPFNGNLSEDAEKVLDRTINFFTE